MTLLFLNRPVGIDGTDLSFGRGSLPRIRGDISRHAEQAARKPGRGVIQGPHFQRHPDVREVSKLPESRFPSERRSVGFVNLSAIDIARVLNFRWWWWGRFPNIT